MAKKTSQKQTVAKRVQIIKTVQTPLGFFVLVVLVVEAILGALAGVSSGSSQMLIIAGMLSLITVLIAVVAFLGYKRPEALQGRRYDPSLRPIAPASRTEVDFLKAFLIIFSPDLSPGDQYSKIVNTHFSKLHDQLQMLENDEDWSSLICIKERLREYFEYSGRYQDGVEFGKVYVRALRHLNRRLEATWTKVKDVGYLLVLDGEHEEGRKYLSEAIEDLRDLDSIEDKLKSECYFYCYRYLGVSYLRDEDCGDITKANECFGKAEEYAKRFASYPEIQKRLIGRIQGNLGNVALVEGRYSEAIQFYKASCEIFRDIGDKEHIGIAKLKLAESLVASENEVGEIPRYLSEAKAMFIDIGWLEGMARVAEQYARYYELLIRRDPSDSAPYYVDLARDAILESKKLYERVGVQKHVGRVQEVESRLSKLAR